LKAGWEVLAAPYSDANTPNTRETAFGWVSVGPNPLNFQNNKNIWGCYTSYLGIHCAVVAEGLRKGDFLVLQRLVCD
jgi:hypothetical protein